MKVTLNPQLSYTGPQLKKNSPAFTSNMMKLPNGQTPNFTYFFREDFSWRSFAKYLQKQFSNADKVNIYSGACSDGTEPFTLVMALIGKLGKENAKKFLPLNAFDLSESLIKEAKSGRVPLLPMPYTFVDIYKLKFKNLFKDGKFLKYTKEKGLGDVVVFNDETRKAVNFKTANILSEVHNMKGENTVVMCRNMWMYLNDLEEELLAYKLGRKLQKKSVVVLGEYDVKASNAVKYLTQNGFEETYIDKVYEKMV